METAPIVEGVRMIEQMERPVRSDSGMLYLGSVDPLTAANWSRECGCAIGTKEFAAYAKKKLQSGEFSHYKANYKRRYV